VARLAKEAGAASVRIVAVPGEWPDGWDLADALPDGVTAQRLREMLEDTPDGSPVDLPEGFLMTPKGLFHAPDPDHLVWVAAPFSIVGETRSDVGDAWGLMLRWRDREGVPHSWAIPRRLIHRPGNDIAEGLEHNGLSCGESGTAHQLLKRFVGAVQAPRLLRCVSRSGWHPTEAGAVFVLPGGEAFGRGAAEVVLQSEEATANTAFRRAGTLEAWKSGVAALAEGNDRLALYLSAAFAGPLLDLLGEPSGGFHLVGDSRTGKSTAAMLDGTERSRSRRRNPINRDLGRPAAPPRAELRGIR
jgi:putative DNA primase/helicase